MKARMESVIGKRIVIAFANEKIVLSEIYPTETTLDDVRHVVYNAGDDLKDLGLIKSWGLEPVFDRSSE